MRLPAARLRAEIDGHAGRVAAAEATLAEVIAEAKLGAQSRYLWQARVTLAALALARGDAGRAADEYRAARHLAEELGMGHAAILCTGVDEVEAAAVADRLEQAEEALVAASRFRGRRGLAEPLLLRANAVLLARRGELDRSEAMLLRAVELQVESALPLERGRTLLQLGAVRRRARKITAARESLADALATFERIGAVVWAERARTELERIGGRTSVRDELTPSERRIAELVAAGKTNREVAAALFITVHTVEAALKRVYRKLDVRSRTELAGRLSGRA
jgi:DNA-binding CsgD family transcriptional regulator